MKSKRNEHIFKDELVVLDYLIHEYKKELKRTNISWNNKTYKSTRKSRLHRLKLEIIQVLRKIEKDYPHEYFAEVD